MSVEPPVLLVVGSVNYDLILSHERLPEAGESLVGASLVESPGGKGANQAVAAARFARDRWPLRVVFGGAVGDDERGRLQRRSLEESGVDVAGLVTIPDAPTGTSTVWVDRGSGENRILGALGANLRYAPEHLDRLPFAEASLVLVPNEIPATTLSAVAERAMAASVPLLWNPAPFPLGAEAPLAPADVIAITPNEWEAAALLGRRHLGDVRTAARELAALGWKRVLITLGPRGVRLLDDELEAELPAPTVEVIDTTGAGDAFSGALAAGVVAGLSWGPAAAQAVRYASASVGHPGTQTAYPLGSAL